MSSRTGLGGQRQTLKDVAWRPPVPPCDPIGNLESVDAIGWIAPSLGSRSLNQTRADLALKKAAVFLPTRKINRPLHFPTVSVPPSIATVKFGTKPAGSVTFVSGTQIKAIVPNGAVTAKISVTTPAGTGTSASNFTVTLSITGFSPATGPTGTVVTINGVGFNSSSTVKFNGATASSVVHVSSTQLKATVPSTARTGPISVTNTILQSLRKSPNDEALFDLLAGIEKELSATIPDDQRRATVKALLDPRLDSTIT